MSAIGADLAGRLRPLVRDVPDFPSPGVVFRDITPLLADAAAFSDTIDGLGDIGAEVDLVAGVEARGFILGAPVALRLGAGFVPVRKHGKLPGDTHAAAYALEYGEAVIEVHQDAFRPGQRVLVVDDVLATGGTLAATVELVRRTGAEVVAASILVEIAALGGRAHVADVDLRTVLVY